MQQHPPTSPRCWKGFFCFCFFKFGLSTAQKQNSVSLRFRSMQSLYFLPFGHGFKGTDYRTDWLHISVFWAFGKQSKEFKASLGYIVRPIYKIPKLLWRQRQVDSPRVQGQSELHSKLFHISSGPICFYVSDLDNTPVLESEVVETPLEAGHFGRILWLYRVKLKPLTLRRRNRRAHPEL